MSLIKRVQQTSDETPPWNGMAFALPVESDKLSEELKRAYPDCKTLRERKHMAAIDFLSSELHRMQSATPTAEDARSAAPQTPSRYDIAPDDRSRCGSPSSMSFTSSAAAEPRLTPSQLLEVDVATPPTVSSPSPHLVRNEIQQFVFSVVDGRSLQPKTKRCMTRDEKVAYKKTRKRGACLPCRRNKGKVCSDI